MALKIIKASEPIEVKQLSIVLYGIPGIGKTSIGSTADSPLLLDFDQGVHRSAFRKDAVRIESWDDVKELDAAALSGYKTVVVDTAGRALDKLTAQIIKGNAKLGNGLGGLTLQGYGMLKSSFVQWLKLVQSFGKDVVLIAHSEESKSGDELIERLDVTGGSKQEIYKSADAMGRLYMFTHADGKLSRTLNFSPTDVGYGKDPGQMGVLKIPDFTPDSNFLGDVIRTIKKRLNERSIASVKEESKTQQTLQDFSTLLTIEEFNAKIGELSKAPTKTKSLFIAEAKTKGFRMNEKTKLFEVAEVAA